MPRLASNCHGMPRIAHLQLVAADVVDDEDVERHGEADEDHGPAGDPGHQVTTVTGAHWGLDLQYKCTENRFTVQVTGPRVSDEGDEAVLTS